MNIWDARFRDKTEGEGPMRPVRQTGGDRRAEHFLLLGVLALVGLAGFALLVAVAQSEAVPAAGVALIR